MDYDPLIERLLEGTISEAERTALEQYMSTSPDAAREVHSLLEVERLLSETAQEEEIHSLAFRESVRSELKSSLGFTATPSTSAPFSLSQAQQPELTGAFSRHLPNVLAVLLTALAVVVVVLPDGSGEPTVVPQQVLAPPALSHKETRTEELPSPTNTATDKAELEKRSQSKQHKDIGLQEERRAISASRSRSEPLAASEQNQPPANPVQSKVLGTISPEGSKARQYQQAIDDATQRLKAHGDNKAAAAVTAKHLALLHEKIAAAQTARTYFEAARQYAHEAGIMETKGEVIGEYALFEQRMGNSNTARLLATESLGVLRAAHSARLGAWESKFSTLLR